MNTSFKQSLLVLFLLSAGFCISASAQRDRNSSQRGNSYSSRNGGNNNNRSNSDDNRRRNTDRANGSSRQNNTGSFERRNNNNNNANDVASADRRNNSYRIIDRNRVGTDNATQRRNSNANFNDNRDRQRSSSRNSNFNSQRTNRNVVINNNVRVNNYYNRYPRVYNYDRSGRYSFVRYNYYAPRRYVYIGAPRYRVIPRTFISINFGGYPYWYDRGCFYGYYDDYYVPVFAPVGIHVTVLPVGYRRIYVGPSPYYYYFEGVYYRNYQDRDNEYEVVDAPMGAVISVLPKGATAAVVNGEKFYEFNGTYYKEGANDKNEVVYTVVGKNGNINNTDEQKDDEIIAPQIGDEITALPENSREVTINGEVLYVTPDNLYLKAETRNNTTTYKVVGKAENK
jgi:hypothetical protein